MKEESVKISIELVGYEEFIEKLNKIKEIKNKKKKKKIKIFKEKNTTSFSWFFIVFIF